MCFRHISDLFQTTAVHPRPRTTGEAGGSRRTHRKQRPPSEIDRRKRIHSFASLYQARQVQRARIQNCAKINTSQTSSGSQSAAPLQCLKERPKNILRVRVTCNLSLDKDPTKRLDKRNARGHSYGARVCPRWKLRPSYYSLSPSPPHGEEAARQLCSVSEFCAPSPPVGGTKGRPTVE